MVKLVKSLPKYHARYVEQALSDGRSTVLRVAIWDEGRKITRLDPHFLLSGLLGLSHQSIAAIGIASRHSRIDVQGYALDDEALETYLRDNLQNYPGIREVAYSHHRVGEGRCAIVEIGWDSGTQGAIHEAVGSNFAHVQEDYSSDRASTVSYDYSKSALETFLSRRLEISPAAVEGRFPAIELPALLGLDREPTTRKASIAALGSNTFVPRAIYVRSWTDQPIADAAGALTEGTDGRKLRLARSPLGEPPDRHAPPPAEGSGWLGAVNQINASAVGLGGSIFSVVDTVADLVCRDEELFDARSPRTDGFDPTILAGVLRELVVNAYAHGHWDSWDSGNDDRETMHATRLAIVHAGNRLELVNRTRRLGYLKADLANVEARRTSALHDAFKDIDWAKGRRLGQAIVRQRLRRMGMPAPLFVKGGGFYRAILPLSDQFTSWHMVASPTERQARDVELLFVARLALLLTHLDEDAVASAFRIRRDEASDLLEALHRKKVLSRHPPEHFSEWAIQWTATRYALRTPESARAFIARVEAGLATMPSESYLSPAALFHLSRWSMSSLPADHRVSAIRRVYESELFSPQEADRLAFRHAGLLA